VAPGSLNGGQAFDFAFEVASGNQRQKFDRMGMNAKKHAVVADPLPDDVSVYSQPFGSRERAALSRSYTANQQHCLTHDPGRHILKRRSELLGKLRNSDRLCSRLRSIVDPVDLGIIGFLRQRNGLFPPVQLFEAIESPIQFASKLVTFVVSFAEFISQEGDAAA
jgi:hypothetical protein